MANSPLQDSLDRFCHQYLQLETSLDFPGSQSLREAHVQDALYLRLFAEDALRYPPPIRYQLRTLKELVRRIESSIEDWDEHGVSDELMLSLSSLLSRPLPQETTAAQQKSYVTYYQAGLPASETVSPQITLLESRNLISAGGTTGLRTWEAALHLGQYLCQNASFTHGRRVLELGAGTGYVSLLCAKFLGAIQVIASDGSDDVVNNLPENFYLNALEDSEMIRPMDLKWGYALIGTEEQDWNGGKAIDLVLGADITYDESIIPALVGTIDELFDMFPSVQVIISATERNRQTFEKFLEVCGRRKIRVENIEFPILLREAQKGPFYSDKVPIRICKLTRATSS